MAKISHYNEQVILKIQKLFFLVYLILNIAFFLNVDLPSWLFLDQNNLTIKTDSINGPSLDDCRLLEVLEECEIEKIEYPNALSIFTNQLEFIPRDSKIIKYIFLSKVDDTFAHVMNLPPPSKFDKRDTIIN